MPVVKKRNQQTETRLLPESPDPVDLPPASIADNAVLVCLKINLHSRAPANIARGFDGGAGSVMLDGSTFAVPRWTMNILGQDLARRSSEMRTIDRVQVISCLPSMRGVQVTTDALDEFDSRTADEDVEVQSYDESIKIWSAVTCHRFSPS